MKEVISTTAAPAAIGPYSQAIKCGNMLFCSGQIPVNPATGEIPEGIKAATATVFLADMSLFGEMNAVYAETFSEPFPARSAVAVRELPKQVLVEIEVIAAL